MKRFGPSLRHGQGFSAVAGWALFVAAGCGPARAPSSGIDAGDMSVAFSVSTTSDESVAVGQLFRFEREGALESGTTDWLYLSGEDKLTTRVADSSSALEDTGETEGPPVYLTRLPRLTPGDEASIELARDGATLVSRVSIPPAPVIVSAPSTFARSAGFDIEVESTDLGDDEIAVDVRGPCIGGTSASTAPSGFVVHVGFDDDSDEACDMTVIVSRVRTGAVDGAFAEGDIEGITSADALVIRSLP